MKNEIKKKLASMQVRDNKEDAEQKAHEIYNMGPDSLIMLIELGMDLSVRIEDEKTKDILRAIILTLFVFYKKDQSQFIDSPYYSPCLDLLIGLYGRGFASAAKVLSGMGISEYDIYRKQLLSLPLAEKHLRDKSISIHEAYQEIRLSKGYDGFKGFMKSHYALGNDKKHAYAIYRIDNSLFALRVKRLN